MVRTAPATWQVRRGPLPGVRSHYKDALCARGKVGNVTVHRIGFTTNRPGIAELKRFPLHLNKYYFQVAAYWKAAQLQGWSDTQLAEAFAYLGLTVFTGYFLNYAQTAPDI